MTSDNQSRVDELKPCPFCGGKAQIGSEPNKHYFVNCRKCYARCQSFMLKSIAILEWNRRHEAAKVEGGINGGPCCTHEAFEGRCVHCNTHFIDGKPVSMKHWESRDLAISLINPLKKTLTDRATWGSPGDLECAVLAVIYLITPYLRQQVEQPVCRECDGTGTVWHYEAGTRSGGEAYTKCKHPEDCDYPDCGTRSFPHLQKCHEQPGGDLAGKLKRAEDVLQWAIGHDNKKAHIACSAALKDLIAALRTPAAKEGGEECRAMEVSYLDCPKCNPKQNTGDEPVSMGVPPIGGIDSNILAERMDKCGSTPPRSHAIPHDASSGYPAMSDTPKDGYYYSPASGKYIQNTAQAVSGASPESAIDSAPASNTDGGLSAAQRHDAEPSDSAVSSPAELGDACNIQPSVSGEVHQTDLMPDVVSPASPASIPRETSEVMVERVARAIHNVCAEIEKPYPKAIPCYSMNKNKDGWRTMAKSAIAAVSEAESEE